jgi:pimeloyl-ACP methyl ester carboxylesterase
VFVAEPPAARPNPTIFVIHGGPESHDRDTFSPPVQSWIDHGLAVVQVNYRGSTGYGRAWRDALTGNPGLTELEDIAAVWQRVVDERIADPERIVLHGGSWGGYRAQLLRFPDQHLSVACLCNLARANPERRALRVADIFLASEMKVPAPAADADGPERKKKETVPVTPDELANYAGQYSSDELFATYFLDVADGKLELNKIQNGLGGGFLQSTEHWQLRPVGKDEFVADDEGIGLTFSRGANQQITGFVLGVGRSTGIAFTRK